MTHYCDPTLVYFGLVHPIKVYLHLEQRSETHWQVVTWDAGGNAHYRELRVSEKICDLITHASRKIHTHTQNQKAWVHDKPLWRLGLNSFVNSLINMQVTSDSRVISSYTHITGFNLCQQRLNLHSRWAPVWDSRHLRAWQHDRWAMLVIELNQKLTTVSEDKRNKRVDLFMVYQSRLSAACTHCKQWCVKKVRAATINKRSSRWLSPLDLSAVPVCVS